MRQKSFAGRHVMLDAFVKHASILRDKKGMLDLLLELAVLLDMEIILGPDAVEVVEEQEKMEAEKFEDYGGISGYCVISTSHLSFHTWPLSNFVSLDLYSCKDFDADKAVNFLIDRLEVSRYNISEVVRRKPV